MLDTAWRLLFLVFTFCVYTFGTIGALTGFDRGLWYRWPCVFGVLLWFVVGGVIFVEKF